MPLLASGSRLRYIVGAMLDPKTIVSNASVPSALPKRTKGLHIWKPFAYLYVCPAPHKQHAWTA